MAPSKDSTSMDASRNVMRKRVYKACDRCRLKKSKCDNSSPCNRCRSDNAICFLGARKRVQDRVYPKGYIEILEKQQTQLVAGLRELYSRLQSGHDRPKQPLSKTKSGHFLVHDILERIGILRSTSGCSTDHEVFQEDCNRIQQKLLERESVGFYSRENHASFPTAYGDSLMTAFFQVDDPSPWENTPSTTSMHGKFGRQSQSGREESVNQEVNMISPPSPESTPLNESMILGNPPDFAKPVHNIDCYDNFDQHCISWEQRMMCDMMDPMRPGMSNAENSNFNMSVDGGLS